MQVLSKIMGLYPAVSPEIKKLPHPLDMDDSAKSADWRDTWSSILERCSPEEAEDIIEFEREAMWRLAFGDDKSSNEEAVDVCKERFWYLTNLKLRVQY